MIVLNKDLSLYVHIPFCIRKCLYCDFSSFSGMDNYFVDYIKCLCREIEDMSADFSNRTVNTIFLGGGTPSVLPTHLLGKVIDTIIKKYNVANNAEISIETNPGRSMRKIFLK